MKFAVVQFPGSNCDMDCVHALGRVLGQDVRLLWHKDTEIAPDEAIILPGGFSYGDYLRCGAIARFSPVIQAVKEAADHGQIVIGICNGFQILCESGLLPGALVRNRDMHFICDTLGLRVEDANSPFTNRLQRGEVLQIPVAHGEGCYIAAPEVIKSLNDNNQVLFRYCDADGYISDEINPNGSIESIAGICNEKRNVLGMMPHPERVCEGILGGEDGRGIFESVIESALASA